MSENFKHHSKHRERTTPDSPESRERKTRIVITKTPPGEWPEHIRQLWVGIELPLAENDEVGRYVLGTSGGIAQNEGGYEVRAGDAIKAVYKKYKELEAREDEEELNGQYYVFWHGLNEQFGNYPDARLVFSRDCCKIKE